MLELHVRYTEERSDNKTCVQSVLVKPGLVWPTLSQHIMNYDLPLKYSNRENIFKKSLFKFKRSLDIPAFIYWKIIEIQNFTFRNLVLSASSPHVCTDLWVLIATEFLESLAGEGSLWSQWIEMVVLCILAFITVIFLIENRTFGVLY